MEIFSLQLQIHSSLKELSRFKNFISESSCKHMSDDGYIFRNEILQDFFSDFQKLCLKADARTGKEKQLNQCNLEVNSSSGIKLLTDSMASAAKKIVSSSRGKLSISSCKGKGVLQAGVVEQLNHRLKILEEETETMKKDIFGALEERRNLVNEIIEQFQILQHHLCLQNQVIGETSCDETSCDDTMISNSPKGGRMETGLSEIVCQEPNLSLVTRDLRANMLAFQEPA
ncbi:uncharacterized protein LOC132187715 isoform X2 [Corylus avellana]|nr:uncharacterized protein LOC132187715 isoform X2 [Corylus avellana]